MTVRLRIAVAILVAAVFVAACATKKTLPIVVGVGEPKAGEPKEAPVDGRGAAGGAPGGRGAGRGGRGGETAAPSRPAAAAPQPAPPPPPPPAAPREDEPVAATPLPEFPAAAAAPSRPIARRAPRSEIEIFYGTNRARSSTCAGAATVKWDSSPACRPNSFYTGSPARRDEGGAGDLEVGRFKVTFPPGHQPGIIERPLTVLTIQLRAEAPSRDVVISELASSGTDYDAWVRAVKATGKRDAFIYVHGYYTSFEAAARQAGQLAFDLEIDRDFAGLPMLYSWPSQGTLKGYGLDYDRSRAAARAFNQFLDLVKERAGVSRVHIIAHSMGNWLVANALQERWTEGHKDRFLQQLVLAAPDISAEDFRDQFLKTLPQLAQRVTLYVSDNDKALRASTEFRTGIPRAGLLEGGLMGVSEPGFEVVDATPLTADFLDHSYYANNRSMLADIYCLLGGSAPSGRPLIMSAGVNWIFRPAAVLAGLNAKACPASQDHPEASAVPPPVAPTAPGGDSDSTPPWLIVAIAMAAIVAAGYLIARRLRRS